jgi:hypothetical protein
MNERQAMLGVEALRAEIASAKDADALRSAMSERWLKSDVLRERAVALQEEIDWLTYVAFDLADEDCLIELGRYEELTCPRGGRPFERMTARVSTIRERGAAVVLDDAECPPVSVLPKWAEQIWERRVLAIANSDRLQQLETRIYKRAWRDTEQNVAEPRFRRMHDDAALREWLSQRIEQWASGRSRAFALSQLVAAIQDDGEILRVAEVLAGRPDFSLENLAATLIRSDAVPSHPFHVYTDEGLNLRESWVKTWELQRREDAGEGVGRLPVPGRYSQGSRGKPRHFLKDDYWKLRGDLDLPRERVIAFTEVMRSWRTAAYPWPTASVFSTARGVSCPKLRVRMLPPALGSRPNCSPSWALKARAES